MKTKEIEKYCCIGTKLSKSSFEQVKATAERGNFQIYNFLQVIIEAVLKTLCFDDVPNEYVKRVVRDFVELPKVRDGFALCAPNSDERLLHVSESLVFVKKGKRKFPEAVLLKTDKNGDVHLKRQEDEILTAFLQAFSPSTLAALERVREEQETHNLTSALKLCVAEMTPERDLIEEEVRELFSDTRFHNGVNFDDVQRCKSTRRPSASSEIQPSCETTDAPEFVPLVENWEAYGQTDFDD